MHQSLDITFATEFATVVEIRNIFDPRRSMHIHTETAGFTVREWLEKRFGKDFVAFETPTVCNINGKWVLEADWDTHRLKPGDLMQFLTAPGYEGIAWLFYVVVAVVIGVAAVLLMPKPVVPGQPPQTDPVWKLSGQYNRNRPGEPIEVAYGRCRLWPSYAHRLYTRYENQNQILYVLLCCGRGYFDIEEIRVEDTPTTNYPEIDIQILNPGETLTLFPDNVITSAEIGGIELFGPNEDEYPVDGWAGPFTLNPAGTLANVLEIDLTFPNGLYASVSDGIITPSDVIFDVQVREIDDDGAPLGAWVFLEEGEEDGPGSIEDSETSPRRFTREYSVEPGRYEMRIRRTNDVSGSAQIVNKMLWESARAYLPTVGVYEGMTCVAIKARASNNLNDNSRSRFNVIATRKLPVWDAEAEAWLDDPEDLVATRSPVMAFCDAMRADYGGTTPDSFLDMEELMAMDERLSELGINFDWVFDQRSTPLEVLRTISRVGRCIPMMAGSRLFMVRDEAATVPVTMFTPSNIFQGSFEQQIKLFALDEYDSTIVEYVDPVTFETKEVLCALPGATTANPERLRLAGCTSRTWAYREGMQISAARQYQRERVKFSTGLEGVIPVYGDLIAVSHDVPEWGSTGVVLEYTVGDGETLLRVSDPVEFPEGETCLVRLRDRYGSPSASFVATSGTEPDEVVIATELDPVEFPIGGADREPLAYTFGVEDLETQLCKVVRLKPGSDEQTEVECIPYNAAVYAYDEADPPEE